MEPYIKPSTLTRGSSWPLDTGTRASKQELEAWSRLLYYALKRGVETLSKISHVSKSSSTSYTHETDICVSHTSSIISRH